MPTDTNQQKQNKLINWFFSFSFENNDKMSETDNNNVPQKKKKTKTITPQAEAMTMATATATKGMDAPVNASTSSMMIVELPSYHKDKVNDHLTDVILDVENNEVTYGI